MQRTEARTGARTGALLRPRIGLAVAAAVVLTACGQAQPGVAATVDGETLTIREVQERATAFFDAYPEAAGAATGDQVAAASVGNFVRTRILDTLGAELGLVPTQGELDEFVDEFGGLEEVTRQVSQGFVPPDPDLVAAEIRAAWIQNSLRELKQEEIDDPAEADAEAIAVLREYFGAADVSINPRYGTWDGSQVTPGNGSLSVLPTGDGPADVAPG